MTVPIQTQMPALGYVTMGDYLGANKGVLDAGYQQDADKAHGMLDVGGVESGARDYAYGHHGTAATAADLPQYQSALDQLPKAQEEGRRLASEAGLAGSGANPVSGPDSFNAALEYGAHGAQYHALSDYLTGFSPASLDAAMAQGNQEGLQDLRANRPPDGTPDYSIPDPRNHQRR